MVLREIRRSGLGFFEVDSAFSSKKSQPGAYTVYAPGCVIFMENLVDLEKPHPQTSDLAWVRYHQQNVKWYIDNSLDAKITADSVHNSDSGFHINI